MGLFTNRKPRRYRPVHIYTDERREKLERLVNEVKREQGDLKANPQPYDTAKFRGKFGQYTPRAQRYKQSERRLGWPFVLVAVFALLLVLRFLLR